MKTDFQASLVSMSETIKIILKTDIGGHLNESRAY